MKQNTYIIYLPATDGLTLNLKLCQNYIQAVGGNVIATFQDDLSYKKLKEMLNYVNTTPSGIITNFICFSRDDLPKQDNIDILLHRILISKGIQIIYIKEGLNTSTHSGKLEILSGHYRDLYDTGQLNYFEYYGNVSNLAADLLNGNQPQGHCQCSICGWKGMRYHTGFYKDGMLENVICPNCNSWSRHRRAWGLLEEGGFIKDGMTVLDTAPMKELTQKLMTKNIQYLSIDIFNVNR